MKSISEKLLCVFAAALVITTSALAAFHGIAYAATHGIYTVTASPYYVHPVTGEIEDSGQNPSIGQAMTESVLEKQALLEVDEKGNHFVTIRFCLMDNIENLKLSVQKDAESKFVETSHTIMKEAMQNATADIRFSIPDENAIVRATFFVVPMGRDVIFYISFSDLVSGSGDFITSIKIDETLQKDNVQTQTSEARPVATPNISTDIDIDSGLTVYKNNKENSSPNTMVLFIVLAVLIVAAIGVIGYIYYKKKINSASTKGGNSK